MYFISNKNKTLLIEENLCKTVLFSWINCNNEFYDIENNLHDHKIKYFAFILKRTKKAFI